MKLWKVIAWLDNNNKFYKTKNILHKKGWGADTNPDHIDPPTITLVKKLTLLSHMQIMLN